MPTVKRTGAARQNQTKRSKRKRYQGKVWVVKEKEENGLGKGKRNTKATGQPPMIEGREMEKIKRTGLPLVRVSSGHSNGVHILKKPLCSTKKKHID